MSTLHPYMAFEIDPQEWAFLIFANTAKEARRIAWYRCDFLDEFIDLRVRRMREHATYLMSLYDGGHVYIDSPPTCPVCETWGAPIRADGAGCEYCYGPDPAAASLIELTLRTSDDQDA